MFTTNPEFEFMEKQVVPAFGLSKMTVADENGAGIEEYETVRFPEFLEMIARMSEIKFKGTA